jgi:hypothetical protein
MSASHLIRQSHRWLSIVFTLTVLANFVAMTQGPPPAWVTYAPLLPLALLLFSGLYCRQRPQRAKEPGMTAKRTSTAADWRTDMLARIRTLIEQADPEIVEEQKWRKPSNGMVGVPVWSHDGIVCTGETYKNAVKMTFARGAELKDPSGLFNASLEGNTRRAIDFHEGDAIDERALKALIKAAVKLNVTDRA